MQTLSNGDDNVVGRVTGERSWATKADRVMFSRFGPSGHLELTHRLLDIGGFRCGSGAIMRPRTEIPLKPD